MILPSELNEKSALEIRSSNYLSEFKTLENKIDGHIKKGELDLLKGKEIYINIHDSQNEYGSLNDVIQVYKEAGWNIIINRPWTALFSLVYLSIPKRNSI